MCLRTSEQNNNLDFIFLKNAKKKQIPWVKKKGKERIKKRFFFLLCFSFLCPHSPF